MIPIMILPSFDVKIKLLYEMYKKVFAAFESLQRNNIPMFYSTIAILQVIAGGILFIITRYPFHFSVSI